MSHWAVRRNLLMDVISMFMLRTWRAAMNSGSNALPVEPGGVRARMEEGRVPSSCNIRWPSGECSKRVEMSCRRGLISGRESGVVG